MSPRIAAALGVVSVAVLGTWWKAKRKLRELAPVPAAPVEEIQEEPASIPPIEIDDDTAAEIIRRARPALERAREIE